MSNITLASQALTGADVKKTFDDNWLNIFDRMHHDVPMSYKIDFLHKAQLTGADPRKNQIYLTSYYSKKLGHKIGTTVFSYHFFLAQANQTGEYEGVEVSSGIEEVFDPKTLKPKSELVSTAIVYRKNKKPVIFKARWSEFFNSNNPMWNSKPYTMLEKTAIANALRWAFPEALSGMFISEEIRDDDLAEIEKIAERESDMETTAVKMEKVEESLKESGQRQTKEQLKKDIIELSEEITKGMNKEERGKFLRETLEVDSFGRLMDKKKDELEFLVRDLKAILTEPIIMS